jgi:hypothetical protein
MRAMRQKRMKLDPKFIRAIARENGGRSSLTDQEVTRAHRHARQRVSSDRNRQAEYFYALKEYFQN